MWWSVRSLSTCSPVMPEKQNMPIWSVTWFQESVDPDASSSARRRLRMSMMRSAMPLTSPYQRCFKDGSPRMVATIAAPCRGGLEYIGRASSFICDSTRCASSASSHMMEKHPIRWPYRPMFLANDCEHPTLCPSSTKMRIAAASRSQSPDANPWYAMSKNGNKRRFFIATDIARHCSSVGSTPVGLCAHACSKKNDPSSAFSMSDIKPSKSNPRVSGL
mmetsp:Transcript_10048/g.42257  ORF Transcript_10048/g.42257 Transcript_10048/m.42257 type:complete len:219 (-) Transcript_10048:578-1234(-)